MSLLKSISKESIPRALVRAKHYRLLNEPWQAESICRDILEVDDDNQKALLYLVLAITDQFGKTSQSSEREAKEFCKKLNSEFEQKYYRGIVAERMGKVALKRATPRAEYIAHDYYTKAMELFEEAEVIQPDGNQDAILRWNACARAIEQFNLKPSPEEGRVLPFLE